MSDNLSSPKNWFGFFDLILIAGTLTCLMFLHFGLQLFEQAQWPSTNAKIENFTLEDVDRDDNNPAFHLKVLYSYSVKGQSFETEEVAVPMLTKSDSAKYLEPYSKGKIVEVRYNPDHPDVSQLASVSKNSKLFLWVAFVLAILVAIGMLFRKRINKWDNVENREQYM